MAYTVPTLAQAQTALAARLNDPNMIHWQSAELTVYLIEALRTWAAWTAHWREGATFVTAAMQPFFDLPTVIPTLRQQSVTQQDLITSMQYSLLEPATPTVWTGTDQFTLAQLTTAIARRRDLFLQLTGAYLTYSETLYGAPAATGRLDLDESILLVQRALWRPTATQLLQPLRRTDEWAADHFKPAWPTSTLAPNNYSTSVTPPLTLQLMPPTSLAGTLVLVSVNKGSSFPDPAAAVTLGVPNDWSWVIKYGALADLLQGDGLALDPQRAAYCEQRWQQGVKQAAAAGVVLAARINDVPCRISSVADCDKYQPVWNLLAGRPAFVAIAGQNLIAPVPMDSFGVAVVDLEVVRNVPVPVAGGDVLQIGGDMYESILDIAQHTALFKEGPAQLQIAMALLDRAAKVAGVTLGLQQASQPSRAPLLEQTSVDTYSTPRYVDPVEVP